MHFSREWGIRAALFSLSPLTLFALLELGLRATGVGFSSDFFVPAPGKHMLVPNPRFGELFFPKRLARVPAPHLLADLKPPGTYRIFVLGESAALGVPEPGFSFGRILEILLAERYPGRRFEVVNTAMTAVNSHAILRIARDCARYSPDLLVVYMGNNEVVGPYGPGTVFTPAMKWLPLIRLNLWQRSTRAGQWIGSMLARKQPEWRGMEMFQGRLVPEDDPRLAAVYRNFRRNLEDIVDVGRRAGIPVLVSTVAVNLKDLLPFAGAAAQEQFRGGHFARARDLDELRFRADSRINAIIREVAEGHGALLADAERAFGPAPGSDLFYEHVHLRFQGNYLLARTVAERIALPEPAAREFPDPQQAAALLAYTPWDEYRMASQMYAMMQRPPFTQRLAKMPEAVSAADSLPAYAAAMELRPADMHLRLRYAELLRAAGRSAEAERMWRALLEQAPTFKEWHAGLASVLTDEGRFDDAVAEYRRALTLDPDYDIAQFGWGVALARQDRNAEAAEHYRQALRINPDYAEAHNNLALALGRLGRTEEAVSEYERALKLKPDYAEAWAGLGAVLFQSGDLNRAADAYARAVQARPQSAELHYDYGIVLSRKGNLDAAVEQYREALRLDAGSADIHNNLGTALARQRRFKEAAAHFQKAVEIRPNFNAARLNLERARHAAESR